MAPERTLTRFTTITQTDHSLTTIIEPQTSTATETKSVTETVKETKTESATATATPDYCDTLTGPIQQQIYGSSIQVITSKDATGSDAARSCCQSCYARPGCVVYRVGGGVCEVYGAVSSFSGSCTSRQCSRGYPDLSLGPEDGKDYYLGPCFGSAVST